MHEETQGAYVAPISIAGKILNMSALDTCASKIKYIQTNCHVHLNQMYISETSSKFVNFLKILAIWAEM